MSKTEPADLTIPDFLRRQQEGITMTKDPKRSLSTYTKLQRINAKIAAFDDEKAALIKERDELQVKLKEELGL